MESKKLKKKRNIDLFKKYFFFKMYDGNRK